jgi:5-methylcytosine-specific restriction enzyme A
MQRGIAMPAEIADHVERHGCDYTKFLTGKLQSLCRSCHSSIKAGEERRGFRLGIGEDGWPLDPRHPVNRSRDPS